MERSEQQLSVSAASSLPNSLHKLPQTAGWMLLVKLFVGLVSFLHLRWYVKNICRFAPRVAFISHDRIGTVIDVLKGAFMAHVGAPLPRGRLKILRHPEKFFPWFPPSTDSSDPPSRSLLIAETWAASRATGLAVLFSLFFLPCAFAQSYWIDRVAGNPSAADDGIPARVAALSFPWDVAVGTSGSFYIADAGDFRIRKVDAAGIITTVAGTGSPGFSGDGGPAVNAQLDVASGVAVDGSGNVYIADGENSRIRKVDAAGTITTIAGTGNPGFSGDDGPAVNAQLDVPSGVAVDGSGNIYIADVGNSRIRKVDAAGTITTIAGTGNSGFSGDDGPAVNAQLDVPLKVAADGSSNLYIADYGSRRIRKVDSAGIITTIAGGSLRSGGNCGPALAAELVDPVGIAVDQVGGIIVASVFGRTVRRLSVTAPSKCTTLPATLSEWTVSRSRVAFGGISSRGCLTLDGPINGVSYLVHTSEWQRRAPGTSVWSTVGGTLRTGRLCAFEPTEPGQYRAAAEVSVGSAEPALYQSANEISGPSVAADTEPTFGTASLSN